MNPTAPQDEYPAYLETVIGTYLESGREAAVDAFQDAAGLVWANKIRHARLIADAPTPIETSIGSRRFTRERAAATYRRDRFHCRYCGGRVIPVALMSLVSDIYPDEWPYVHTYKRVHPAYWVRGAEADHIVPGSRGGHWEDQENHATACVRCNTMKSDYRLDDIGWRLLPIEDPGWDGLTRSYAPLWEAAGRPREAYHRPWIVALTPDEARIGNALRGCSKEQVPIDPTPSLGEPAPAKSRPPTAGMIYAEQLNERMAAVAKELGLRVKKTSAGWNYRPMKDEPGGGTHSGGLRSGVGVTQKRGAEFNLEPFRALGRGDLADDLVRRIRAVTGKAVSPTNAAVPCESLLEDWPRTRRQIMVPYFEARKELLAQTRASHSE